MTDNPYQPPQTSSQVIGVLSGSREDLCSIAIYQKGVLVCIVIDLIMVVGSYVVPSEMNLWFAIVVLLVDCVAAAFVTMLAAKTYGTALGILLGGIVLGVHCRKPLLGLLILLAVNGKATAILKQNGIKVGFFGANVSSI
jgi:hypothetical protein